ncbi:hypothetical protein FPV67DRAFT_1008334 [Lyophyllum atratum]|nr:hypothetical protein FPV67DRAFT_1008334 [Lyophyllum atratum]
MDDELKALKVADLKAILAKAHVQVSSKTNKPDLVAKILSSQPALDAYKSMYKPDADLLAPPEDDEWIHLSTSDTPAVPAATELPILDKQDTTDANDANDAKDAPEAKDTPVDGDTEAEKRRKRAERFGIPVVEPPIPRPPRAAASQKRPPLDVIACFLRLPHLTHSTQQDPEKLDARSARFGTTTTTAQKRRAPAETIDAEEQEKRRKRAERFGVASAA